MSDEKKRHLLIFFKTGGVVKIEDLPAGFDFAGMCMTVRSAGYFNNGVLYFPHEVINGMAYVLSEADLQFTPNDGVRSTLQ
jgi:hypothetical protein